MTESHREEIAKLEALYASNPGGRVFVHLAEAYRKAGELERARGILSEGLARHADSASGFVVLGRVLSDLDAPDEAVEAFRRVLDLDAGNLIALRGLGDMARSGGRLGEAVEHYRELLSRNPSNEEVRALLSATEREAEAPHRPAAGAEAPGAAAAEARAEAAAEADAEVEAATGEPPAVHASTEAPSWSPLAREPIEQPISPHAAAPGSTGPAESAEPVFDAAEPGVDALPGDLATFAGLAPERETGPETAAAEDDAEAVSLAADEREVDLQALLDAATEDATLEVPEPAEPAAEPVDAEVFLADAPLEAFDIQTLEMRTERDLAETAGGSAAEFEGGLDSGSQPLPLTGHEDDFGADAGTPAATADEQRADGAEPAMAGYEDAVGGEEHAFDAGYEAAAERDDEPATAGYEGAVEGEEHAFATSPEEGAPANDGPVNRGPYGADSAERGEEADTSFAAGAHRAAADDSSIAADSEGAAATEQPHDVGEALPAWGEEDEREGAGPGQTEPAEWAGEFPELTLASGEGEPARDVEPTAPDWSGEARDDERDEAPHSTFSLWLGEDADAGSVEELAAELPDETTGVPADAAEPGAGGAWPPAGEAEADAAPFEFDLDTVELGEAVQWDAAETDGWPTLVDSEAAESVEAVDAGEAAGAIEVGEPAGAELANAAGPDEGAAADAAYAAEPRWSLEEAEPAAAEPRAFGHGEETSSEGPAGDADYGEAAIKAAGGADERTEKFAAASGGAEWTERGLETETMADLYLSQGFNERAAEVYRVLLRRRPDDERLQGKLAQAESRPVAGVPGGADDEADAGEVWLRGVGAAWTDDSAPAGGEAAYVWTEPGLAALEPEEEGEPIGSYLQSLASWRPDPGASAEGGTEATAAGAAHAATVDLESEPAVGADPETSGAASEPWADASADAGVEPWLETQPEPAEDRDPWATEPEPDQAPEEAASLELTEPVAGAGAQGGAAPSAAGGRETAGAAFDEWYGRPEPSPEPPAEAEEDDEDLAMFRSWLQSLKK
jgi:tetratricopeptide (TPR) repeat protein